MFHCLPLLLSIGMALAATHGPICPTCIDSDTAACMTLVRCEADEECYTQKYVTATGSYKFKSGCEKKTVCRALSKRSVKHVVGPVVCESCCASTGCIGSHCESKRMYPQSRACFSCSAISDPEECKTAVQCYSGSFGHSTQKCLTYEYRVPLTNQIMYSMGCATQATCESLEQQAGTIHSNGHNHWYNQTCCNRDFCNKMGSTDHLLLPSNNSASVILG